MATPHIKADKNDIAKVMVMVGDPLRAKMVAEKFLENPKLINQVRGMLGYTGKYNGKDVTVMGHGMGISSIGIYAYELFDQYDVDVILRAGSCGSLETNIKVRDIIISELAYTDSANFGLAYGEKRNFNESDKDLMKLILDTKEKLNLKSNIHIGNILSSQWFYKSNPLPEVDKLIKDNKILAIEMEAYALNAIAKALGKKSATILTVSDHIVTGESLLAEERQKSFIDMIKLSLEAITK